MALKNFLKNYCDNECCARYLVYNVHVVLFFSSKINGVQNVHVS